MIENPNSSGQGYDADHVFHPFYDIVHRAGYYYSHTTPVVYPGNVRIMHHTFNRSGHHVTLWTRDGHPFPYRWETSCGTGTGRGVYGNTLAGLEKHLASKRRRYRELRIDARATSTHYKPTRWDYLQGLIKNGIDPASVGFKRHYSKGFADESVCWSWPHSAYGSM